MSVYIGMVRPAVLCPVKAIRILGGGDLTCSKSRLEMGWEDGLEVCGQLGGDLIPVLNNASHGSTNYTPVLHFARVSSYIPHAIN